MATATQEFTKRKPYDSEVKDDTRTQEDQDDSDSSSGFDQGELRRMAKKAGRNVREFLNDKSEQASDIRDNSERMISSHPFSSVATALVGGLLLGAFLSRR